MSKYLLSNFKPLKATNTWGIKVFARNFSSLPHGAASFFQAIPFFLLLPLSLCCFVNSFGSDLLVIRYLLSGSCRHQWLPNCTFALPKCQFPNSTKKKQMLNNKRHKKFADTNETINV